MKILSVVCLILLGHASVQASTIPASSDLTNTGKDCWYKCGSKQGPCEWCGTKGMCCKNGFKDKSNGCDGTFGGLTRHECDLKEKCGYTRLQNIIRDEGNALGTYNGKSLSECGKQCDRTKKCNSFGYCPGATGCHLFDKKITETEPLKSAPHYDCFTNYKTCVNGENNGGCFWLGTAPFCDPDDCPNGTTYEGSGKLSCWTGKKKRCCPLNTTTEKLLRGYE